MNKLSFALLFGSLLFFASCSNTPTDEFANTPPGTLTTSSALSYDWGDINIQGGNVSHTFTFQNTGDGPVKFETATTSCMCTTATITLSNGAKSPAFGMHGSNSWGKYIAAGESASITVTFDPMAHGPSATGPISRKVYVATSAKADGTMVMSSPESKDNILTLSVSGNVLSEEDYQSNNMKVSTVSSTDISAADLKTLLTKKDFFLLDVHIPEQEHIAGTDAFIPYDAIEDHLDKLPSDKDAPIVLYCRSGSMSKAASQTLLDLGYTNIRNVLGGRNAFEELE